VPETDNRLDRVSGCFRTRVTYSEVDALAYAHHGAAVIWFEQAREAYFRDLGLAFMDFAREGEFFALRELSIKYQDFVAYQDLVEVRAAVTRLARVSCDMHYRVDNRRTGKTAVVGSTTLVAVERPPLGGGPPKVGRLTPIRALLEPKLISPEEFFALPLPPEQP
jgi:YbgC/YbaW family acyl-CoA thioester hydrolase